MKLLRAVQRDLRHVIRLLATAYAEKDVAIAAVNQGKVLRILEKPLDGERHPRGAARGAGPVPRAGAGARRQRGPRGGAARGARLPGARTEHAAGHGARLRRHGRGAYAARRTRQSRPASRTSARTIPASCWRRWSAPSAARCTASRWCPPSCSRRAMPIRARLPQSISASSLVRGPAGRIPVRGATSGPGSRSEVRAGLPPAGPARPAVPGAVHADQERAARPARPARAAAAHRGRAAPHGAGGPARLASAFATTARASRRRCWPSSRASRSPRAPAAAATAWA